MIYRGNLKKTYNEKVFFSNTIGKYVYLFKISQNIYMVYI